MIRNIRYRANFVISVVVTGLFIKYTIHDVLSCGRAIHHMVFIHHHIEEERCMELFRINAFLVIVRPLVTHGNTGDIHDEFGSAAKWRANFLCESRAHEKNNRHLCCRDSIHFLRRTQPEARRNDAPDTAWHCDMKFHLVSYHFGSTVRLACLAFGRQIDPLISRLPRSKLLWRSNRRMFYYSRRYHPISGKVYDFRLLLDMSLVSALIKYPFSVHVSMHFITRRDHFWRKLCAPQVDDPKHISTDQARFIVCIHFVVKHLAVFQVFAAAINIFQRWPGVQARWKGVCDCSWCQSEHSAGKFKQRLWRNTFAVINDAILINSHATRT